MMAVSSPQGIAGEQLKRMFALSPSFQAEAGGSASSAASRVYFGSVPDLRNQSRCPRPLAVIGFEDGMFSVVAGGDQTHLRQRGKLRYWIIRNSTGDDVSAAEISAMDFFSNTLTDVANLSGAEDTGSAFGLDHLNIVRIDNDDFGLCPDEQWVTLGKFFACSGVVTWGDTETISNG